MAFFGKRELSASETDMTQGSILKQIIIFGLPILIGNIFQQLYSMVDTIVVGHFVGTDALGAVGSASLVSWFIILAASGLTAGASIVISQLFGARRYEDIRKAISTTLIFAFAVAIVVSALAIIFAEGIMRLVKVPEALMDDSVAYLKIFAYGSLFTMLYNFFASTLRAIGDSVTPLIFLVICSVLNIFGDLYFVIELNMGVPGVALATILSELVSVILCAVYSVKKIEYFHFSKGEFGFYKELFSDIVRISVPSALQSSLCSVGMLSVQGLINTYGAVSMAAYTATSKLEGLAHLPVECFSMSLSIFVGQNMGAGKVDRVKKGLGRTVLFSTVICLVMTVVIMAAGPALMRVFVDEGAADVIELGAAFLKIWAPMVIFFMFMSALSSTLRGSGDSVYAMIAMFADLGVRAIAAYLLARTFNLGFMGVGYAIVLGWFCAALIAFIRYMTGKWKDKTISAAIKDAPEA